MESINEYYGITDIDCMKEALEDTYGDLSLVAASPFCQAVAQLAVEQIQKELKFETVYLLWSQEETNDKDALGVYIHSSALNNKPVIIIYEQVLENITATKSELRYGLETTIYHELFHAVVDIDEAHIFVEDDNILSFIDEEDYVENLALNFYNGLGVPAEIKQLVELFKAKAWIDINEDYYCAW